VRPGERDAARQVISHYVVDLSTAAGAPSGVPLWSAFTVYGDTAATAAAASRRRLK